MPEGYQIKILENTKGIFLEPNEEKKFHLTLKESSKKKISLEAPFDGDINGIASGTISGQLSGVLTKIKPNNDKIKGLLSANIQGIGSIVGQFEGKLDVKTRQINGTVHGNYQSCNKNNTGIQCIHIVGFLMPWRRVEIAQLLNGEILGGISIQIQIPTPDNAKKDLVKSTNIFAKINE